jgi:hypothetical protein
VVLFSILFHSEAIAKDINISLEPLDRTLFPGVSSSVKVHSGFSGAHAKYVELKHRELGEFLILALSFIIGLQALFWKP